LPEQSNELQLVNGNCFQIAHLTITSYLELKPLSEISDEDAFFIANMFRWHERDSDILEVSDVLDWLEDILDGNCALYSDYVSGYQFIELLDFLRSKSYAIPFHDLSVEQQVEYGWVKLNQN